MADGEDEEAYEDEFEGDDFDLDEDFEEDFEEASDDEETAAATTYALAEKVLAEADGGGEDDMAERSEILDGGSVVNENSSSADGDVAVASNTPAATGAAGYAVAAAPVEAAEDRNQEDVAEIGDSSAGRSADPDRGDVLGEIQGEDVASPANDEAAAEGTDALQAMVTAPDPGLMVFYEDAQPDVEDVLVAADSEAAYSEAEELAAAGEAAALQSALPGSDEGAVSEEPPPSEDQVLDSEPGRQNIDSRADEDAQASEGKGEDVFAERAMPGEDEPAASRRQSFGKAMSSMELPLPEVLASRSNAKFLTMQLQSQSERPQTVPDMNATKVSWKNSDDMIAMTAAECGDSSAMSTTDPTSTRKRLTKSFSRSVIGSGTEIVVDSNLHKALREVKNIQNQGQSGKVVTEHFASKGPGLKKKVAAPALDEIFEYEAVEAPMEIEVDDDPFVAGGGTSVRKSQLTPTPEKVDGMRWDFEGKESPSQFQARQRSNFKKRRNEVVGEADRFLDMMRKEGGGSVAVAWRRHFDSDGDGELSFVEFCNALAEMNYEVDTVQLWHQFGGGLDNKALSLEVLDPKGAEVLDFFAKWCKDMMGGPMEVFEHMDSDGSDSLEPVEMAEGLRELGFFDVPDLPYCLDSEEKVLTNLYPLLDQSGHGCVQAEQFLFLEQDKEKKIRYQYQIKRNHDFGKEAGGIEISKDADDMLNKVYLTQTQLGRRFWKMIPANNVLPTSAACSPKSSCSPSPQMSPKRAKSSNSMWGSPSASSLSPKAPRTPKGFPSEVPQICVGFSPSSTSLSGPSGYPSAISPTATDGFQSGRPSQGYSPPGTHASLNGSFSEGSLARDFEPAKPGKGRLDCLASSVSLPQLSVVAPDVEARARKALSTKNNMQIRKHAKGKMRGARSIYGGALVAPLPPVNPKEPFVPAKASLILPDTRLLPQKQPDYGFNPVGSAAFDFFRSGKSHSLFHHYCTSLALEQH